MEISEPQLAAEIKSDTLTLLLCNQVHKHLPVKARAIKISKCAKVIRDRTEDSILYNACRSVIKATTGGAYSDVVASIVLTEHNYFREYNNA